MMMDRRKRVRAGFTLAELMIVVAIMGILAAFGFVAVAQHQRQLKLTEADNIAREIYEGAQNHLTAASSSGAWETKYESYDSEEDLNAYYGDLFDPSQDTTNTETVSGSDNHDFRTITINASNADSELADTALSMFLPLGSIDETVRTGGTYVIEYDAATAQVYGVFYTEDQDFDTDDVANIDLASGRTSDEVRIQYSDDGGKYAVGYYGGATAKKQQNSDTELTDVQAPEVELLNEERLILKVTYVDNANLLKKSGLNGTNINVKITLYDTADSSSNYTVSLSEADASSSKTEGEAGSKYSVITKYFILDSIVDQNRHLSVKYPDLAGKNIAAKVTVSFGSGTDEISRTRVSNTANSLYADGTACADDTVQTARIANARHLENLSTEVNPGITVNRAIIVNDIIWNDGSESSNDFFDGIRAENSSYFKDEISDTESNTVYFAGSSNKAPQAETFYGIVSDSLSSVNASSSYSLSYFTIAAAGSSNENVGLFSTINHDVKLFNLDLENFTLNGSSSGSNGGALIGQAADYTYELTDINVSDLTVTGTFGNVGGIVGTVDGSASLTAASSSVTDPLINGNASSAGGMIGGIGTSQTVKVSSSSVASDSEAYFTGGGTSSSQMAGGLIGSVASGTATVKDSYVSSEKGKIGSYGSSAGGFIAQIDGGTVNVSSSYVSVAEVADLSSAAGNGSGVGGLIGRISSGGKASVSETYVAGRTTGGKYDGAYAQNVYAGGNDSAGGFIGRADGTLSVTDSYTTASVYSNASDQTAYAGGFIGYAGSGVTLNQVYSTGVVSDAGNGETKGAFAGSASGSFVNCYALKGINPSSLGVTGDSQTPDGISYDSTSDTEGVFVSSGSVEAQTYDSSLSSPYAFKSTAELAGGSGGSHIGDWPIPEKDDYDAAVVYYEVVDGTYYYKGYKLKFDGSSIEYIQSENSFLEGTDANNENKYVTEDGYAVLFNTTDQVDVNQIQIHQADQTKTLGSYATASSALADGLGMSDYTAYILNPKYYTYYGEDTEASRQIDTGTYLTDTVNSTQTVKFYMNPIFARCISDQFETLPKINQYEIRSARQLAYFLGNTDGNTIRYLTSGSNNSGFVFNQTMDIRFDDSQTSAKLSASLYATYQGVAPAGYTRKIVGMTTPFADGIDSNGKLLNLNFTGMTADSIITGNNSGLIQNLVVDNSTFNLNAVIKGSNSSTVDSVTLSNVTVNNGNGIAASNEAGANASITNITIQNSKIPNGNGVIGASNSGSKLENITISGSEIGLNGVLSGIEAAGTVIKTVKISGSTIGGNGISDNVGSGCSVDGVTITGSTISGNGICDNLSASGSYVINVAVDSSTISGNGIGGTIESSCYIDQVAMTNTTIAGNGICNDLSASGAHVTNVAFTGSKITGNGIGTAVTSGCYIDTVTVTNTEITGNGICDDLSASKAYVSNVAIAGSKITGNGIGGTVYSSSYVDTVSVTNTSIAGNGVMTKVDQGGKIRNVSMNDVSVNGNGIAQTLYYGVVYGSSLHNVTIGGSGIADTVQRSQIYANSIVNATIVQSGLVRTSSSQEGYNTITDNHIYGDKSVYDSSATHTYYTASEDSDGNLTAVYGAYELVKIGLKSDGTYSSDTAGLIGSSANDNIYGNSVTGMVYGSNTTAGFIGTMNSSQVYDNYANTLVHVSGTGTGAAFVNTVKSNGQNSKVERCAAFGTVTADSASEGQVSGFAFDVTGTSELGYCYSAVWDLSGNTSYAFYKNKGYNASFVYCSYISANESAQAPAASGLTMQDISYYQTITDNPTGSVTGDPFKTNSELFGLKVVECYPYNVFISSDAVNVFPIPQSWKVRENSDGSYYAYQETSSDGEVPQVFYGDWYVEDGMIDPDATPTGTPSNDLSAAVVSASQVQNGWSYQILVVDRKNIGGT
jgi:prepilin-type N-terminal cleavage/methylation domain-containing protein